ncbi:Nitroreductase [Kocuria varians]
MSVMSTTLLRILAQRRPASLLTQEAPRREDLEAILRAAAGPRYDDRPTGWRAVVTNRQSASVLAAAMAGLTAVPNLTGPVPRLKGRKIRMLAAYRGSLSWASRGGATIAVVFRHDPELPESKKVQRGNVHAARGVLEAAFYTQGWATIWSQREPFEREIVRDFYDLDEHEEVLGWLFLGRAAADSVPSRAINLPPRDLGISYL